MAKKQIILCDTNILIDFYKGNQEIISSLKKIGEENIAVSDITLAEIFYGARDKKDLAFLRKQLNGITTISINESISRDAVELIEYYALSHRLSLADAFIAATAIFFDIELYTLNIKDFKFIEGLRLFS